eukprot:364558-Chlamydomonas_euryale.AAC.10
MGTQHAFVKMCTWCTCAAACGQSAHLFCNLRQNVLGSSIIGMFAHGGNVMHLCQAHDSERLKWTAKLECQEVHVKQGYATCECTRPKYQAHFGLTQRSTSIPYTPHGACGYQCWAAAVASLLVELMIRTMDDTSCSFSICGRKGLAEHRCMRCAKLPSASLKAVADSSYVQAGAQYGCTPACTWCEEAHTPTLLFPETLQHDYWKARAVE